MKRVCAWCLVRIGHMTVVEDGPEPETHTCCSECDKWLFENLEKEGVSHGTQRR